jgi:uncharacterized protein
VRQFTIILFFIAFVFLAKAQTYSVETVPNPKEQSNSYVSNPDSILTEDAVARINNILGELERTNSTQVAVVAIQSIGDEEVFDFAQALFQHWGIGHKETDNGLLILLVMEKRKIRFHTGEGLEGVLPDAVCKRIQREKMVPYFASDSYSAGMEEGVRDVVNILSNEEFAEEAKALVKQDTREHLIAMSSVLTVVLLIAALLKWASTDKIRRMPHIRRSMKNWMIWYWGLPAIVIIVSMFTLDHTLFYAGLYFIFWLGLFDRYRRLNDELAMWDKQKEFRANYEFLKSQNVYWVAMCFFFPIPALVLLPIVLRKRNFYRNYPRACTTCGAPAQKLSESTEDRFLTDAQIAEENLKSVDYDVWKCTKCESFRIETYEDPYSKYVPCKKCNAKAYYRVGTETKRHATRFSEGSKQVTFLCKFCGLSDVTVIVIPILTVSSDSSDGSSSSSDSGSFDGGSSSGGGSESSW